MSLLRNTSDFKVTAPPPSPIPTAKGSRSAATPVLSEYIEKTLHIPDLSLPPPYISLDDDDDHHNDDDDSPQIIPEEIDYRLLELGDYETIDRLLRSAKEFGAFLIVEHGIFDDDLLRSLSINGDRIFRDLEQAKIRCQGDSGDRNKEKIDWVQSGNQRVKCARDSYVAGNYSDFSEIMEITARKLDTIAELLGQVFVENIARLQFGKMIQGKESILSLYRYNNRKNHTLVRNPPPIQDKNSKYSDHTLCLHLPATRSRFSVQSASGPLSFHAGPSSIVVVIGQRFEEWSMGDFKCASGELICEPHFRENKSCFSIEFKCLSLNLDPTSSNKHCNTITIMDQILIMLVIVLLYKIVMFLFS